MKRILLILLIALASLPRLSAAVGDGFKYDGLWYKVLDEDDLTAEVGWNVYVTGDIVIPSIVAFNGVDYTVTSIGNDAFYSDGSLTSVNIPNSVTSIGNSAFGYCTRLTEIKVEAGSEYFSSDNGVLYNLDKTILIKYPEGKTETEFTIPNSVTFIGNAAFDNCISLTEIKVEAGSEYFSSDNGVLYNLDKTILIKYPSGKTKTRFTIPPSVTSIGESAFGWCYNLTAVDIPKSVTSIGESAFYYCYSLTAVEIPESVTSISDEAFCYCTSLTAVDIPESVTSIGDCAFMHCYDLTAVDIPESVTSIGIGAFRGCSSLTAVDIPELVTSIGEGAFCSCSSLTAVDIPESVTSIGISAFQGCSSLTAVEIPESVTSIGKYAFWGCSSLTAVDIPESVTSIGIGAFRGCSSLTAVEIPESVTSISDEAFEGCHSLTTVTIPESVTSIGDEAFEGCTSLTKIVNLNSTPQSVGVRTFNDVPRVGVVYIPKGSYAAYSTADRWSRFKNFREMDANIALSITSVELNKGESVEITASVGKYEDMTIESDEWSSSNTDVATVNGGKVIAIAPGTTVISYTVVDGYGVAFTDSCNVTVNPILAASIALDRTELVLTIGAIDKLTATVLPDDVTDKTVIWTSSDDTIVTVDEDGNIQALSLGEATITATCGDKSATCKITVDPILAESITLDKTELTLSVGASEKLTATVLPEDVTDKTVTWSTSDASIATVDAEGNVTAISVGEATITATCGDKSATCKITVDPILAESITLDKTELTLTVGASEKLTATVLPEDVTDKTVTWSTSDVAIATVDTDGNVTAVAVGEAAITATCGDKSATCKVTVNPIFAESITLNKTELTLTIGASDKLTATVLPEDVTDKTVTWSTSDVAIATVDTDGNVTAVSIGEAAITATCGETSATCLVFVENTSGLVAVAADGVNIIVNGSILTITGVNSDDKVTIARQDGAVIYSGNNRENYTLVRGLYLVIVNGATYKVVIH